MTASRLCTQSEFAEIVGVSHATLSAIKNGKPVSSTTIMRTLLFLGSLIRTRNDERFRFDEQVVRECDGSPLLSTALPSNGWNA